MLVHTTLTHHNLQHTHNPAVIKKVVCGTCKARASKISFSGTRKSRLKDPFSCHLRLDDFSEEEDEKKSFVDTLIESEFSDSDSDSDLDSEYGIYRLPHTGEDRDLSQELTHVERPIYTCDGVYGSTGALLPFSFEFDYERLFSACNSSGKSEALREEESRGKCEASGGKCEESRGKQETDGSIHDTCGQEEHTQGVGSCMDTNNKHTEEESRQAHDCLDPNRRTDDLLFLIPEGFDVSQVFDCMGRNDRTARSGSRTYRCVLIVFWPRAHTFVKGTAATADDVNAAIRDARTCAQVDDLTSAMSHLDTILARTDMDTGTVNARHYASMLVTCAIIGPSATRTALRILGAFKHSLCVGGWHDNAYTSSMHHAIRSLWEAIGVDAFTQALCDLCTQAPVEAFHDSLVFKLVTCPQITAAAPQLVHTVIERFLSADANTQLTDSAMCAMLETIISQPCLSVYSRRMAAKLCEMEDITRLVERFARYAHACSAQEPKDMVDTHTHALRMAVEALLDAPGALNEKSRSVCVCHLTLCVLACRDTRMISRLVHTVQISHADENKRQFSVLMHREPRDVPSGIANVAATAIAYEEHYNALTDLLAVLAPIVRLWGIKALKKMLVRVLAFSRGDHWHGVLNRSHMMTILRRTRADIWQQEEGNKKSGKFAAHRFSKTKRDEAFTRFALGIAAIVTSVSPPRYTFVCDLKLIRVLSGVPTMSSGVESVICDLSGIAYGKLVSHLDLNASETSIETEQTDSSSHEWESVAQMLIRVYELSEKHSNMCLIDTCLRQWARLHGTCTVSLLFELRDAVVKRKTRQKRGKKQRRGPKRTCFGLYETDMDRHVDKSVAYCIDRLLLQVLDGGNMLQTMLQSDLPRLYTLLLRVKSHIQSTAERAMLDVAGQILRCEPRAQEQMLSTLLSQSEETLRKMHSTSVHMLATQYIKHLNASPYAAPPAPCGADCTYPLATHPRCMDVQEFLRGKTREFSRVFPSVQEARDVISDERFVSSMREHKYFVTHHVNEGGEKPVLIIKKMVETTYAAHVAEHRSNRKVYQKLCRIYPELDKVASPPRVEPVTQGVAGNGTCVGAQSTRGGSGSNLRNSHGSSSSGSSSNNNTSHKNGNDTRNNTSGSAESKKKRSAPENAASLPGKKRR
jgi:hypothetical protein